VRLVEEGALRPLVELLTMLDLMMTTMTRPPIQAWRSEQGNSLHILDRPGAASGGGSAAAAGANANDDKPLKDDMEVDRELKAVLAWVG
jgi:hypothetical protein